jgi:phage terminase large subunit-like protein
VAKKPAPGGAAGGGKSVALLAAALQYAEVPGYTGLILRRTYKQLSKADSILNKSKEWLMNRKGVRWNGDEHKWTFPSGATLEFGHMDNENAIYNYQGGAWTFIGVDEATQFTEQMIAYPRSRQRRPIGSQIPIRWRGASNPGGVGHEHIKARYVKRPDGTSPQTMDRRFFPATLADNPNLDREEYIRTLRESGIDPITLDQLEKGNWDAVPGGKFRRSWFCYYVKHGDHIALKIPDSPDYIFDPKQCIRFLTVDPAASAKDKSDWTVISVWLISPKGHLIWLDCIRFHAEIPEIVPEIAKVWLRYKPAFAGIEAVAANQGVLQLAQRHTNPVITARRLSPLSQDKLVRATPAINLVACRKLFLPFGSPTFPLDDVEGELIRFTGVEGQDANDDIVDTLSYAVECAVSKTPQTEGAVPTIFTTGML